MPPVIAAAALALSAEGLIGTIISFVAKTVIGLVVSQSISGALPSKPRRQ